MKKYIYPIMIILVSFIVGYTWYRYKNNTKVKKIISLCIDTNNCKDCPYTSECYGIDDNID